MNKILIIISSIFFGSIGFAMNLDSDFSGQWVIEFENKDEKPVDLTITKSNFVNNHEILGDFQFYSLETNDALPGCFGMSILKIFENYNHIVWHIEDNNVVDFDSNIIVGFEGNSMVIGGDGNPEKYAIMRKK